MKINVVDKSAIDMVAHFLGKILVKRLKIEEFDLVRLGDGSFECEIYYLDKSRVVRITQAHNKGAMAAVRGALTLVARDLLK